MQDASSTRTGSPEPLRAGSSDRPDAVDRSHLLRRSTKFPFRVPMENHRLVRIRRQRRVFAPFRGIPPLARKPRD